MTNIQRTINDITSFMFIEDYIQVCDLIIIPGTSQTQPIDILSIIHINETTRLTAVSRMTK